MKIYKNLELCEYKDLKFEIELEYYFDDFIEEYYVDRNLGNENLRKIRNEYRRLKGLLTDEEIKEIRSQYNLSQRDFALALGLGEVTITRYESKTVQEKAQDEIIKQCKNPRLFLSNLEKNKVKFIEVNGIQKYEDTYDIASKLTKNIDFLINQLDEKDRGNSKFSIEKTKAVIKRIKENRNTLTKTILAKFLWYIDNLSYKLTGKSMTGLAYISMPFGAYPKMYEEILSDDDIEVKLSYYNEYECHSIENVKASALLSAEEEQIIDFILEKFKGFNSKKIVCYMHKEKAYVETELFETISYDYSSHIKVFQEYK